LRQDLTDEVDWSLDLVNPWQPEGVLGAVLVEVGVVKAHPPLVRVLLADEDGVGEPLLGILPGYSCKEEE
jgi:hypothetical protein